MLAYRNECFESERPFIVFPQDICKESVLLAAGSCLMGIRSDLAEAPVCFTFRQPPPHGAGSIQINHQYEGI